MSSAVAGGSPDSSRRRGRTYDGDKSLNEEENNRIKPEPDSDIKDYAESTMNELLGWYGLDKLDTRGLNLKTLNHHFPTSSSSSSPVRHDEDMSEEELSHSPHIESESMIANPSNETITCDWCLKTGLKLFTLKTSSGKIKVFCSEPCFNQCRRAAFKKNRVCNWCRHVRHTVNYVDFKDGDEQLQFCSDKCLNQYKMQIFCRETQAYLQMNPHLQEETSKNAGTANSKLITPDLWLRDCQEVTNGELSHSLPRSDDDSLSPSTRPVLQSPVNDVELEDLSVKSRTERFGSIPLSQREYSNDFRKSNEVTSTLRDKRSNNACNVLSSYLREEKDKSSLDRRKRHSDGEREHYRKKQRMSHLRHRINHQQEAPPAHLSSSVHPPMPFQNQSTLFQSPASTYLPTLNSNAPSLTPPAAHSKSTVHLPMAGSLLPPGLPPPPPLLNSEFLHSQFHPQFFPSPLNPLTHQQQLETILRMQSTMARRGDSFSQNIFPESPLPSLRASSPQYSSGSSMPSNTVMLPYPIFLPLPVPIPIPIPLSCFLRKDQKKTGTSDQEPSKDVPINGDKVNNTNSDTNVDEKLNSVTTKCRNDSDIATNLTTKKEKPSVSPNSSYAVTNNDSQTNRLILTRNKPR